MLSPSKLKSLKVLKGNSQRFSTIITPEPIKLAHAVYEQETISDNQVNPFIIAHGLLGSKQNWTSLCKAYTQKFNPPRKVIALDLRNHGESTHSDEHTYNHLVEDVKQFLIDNNISKVALMGHSMGGRCAMLFALKYPEFLEKLVVVDISPFNLSPNIHEMPIILDTMRRIQMPSNVPLSQARNIIDEQLKKVITDKGIRAFILTNLTAVGDNKSYKWRVNIPTLLKQFKEIAKFDTVEGLQYKGETLFIGGAKSDYIPKMSPAQNFCKFMQKLITMTRCKADLAQTQPYSALDLAYISYQNTDTIFGNVKRNEVTVPLLILHGLLGSKSNFHTICKRYHGGFKPKRLVYAVDLRNHGDSPQLNHNTYEDMVLDVLNFVRVMRLTKIYLLGHDIGGRIGMLICLKYPEIIEKLVVVDASPISTSHNFQIYAKILQILNTMILPANLSPEQARADVINRLSRVVKNKGLMTLVLMNLTQIIGGSYMWRFNQKVLLDHLQELGSFPNVHNVQYKGPVLFVGGGKSDYIQRSDFPKILQLFPKAELKYIEGAGHWVHAEKPNEFLKITMEFLNKTAAV